MSEKASKGTFLKPEKLQNNSNKGKGEKKRAKRGKGAEEKKAMVALLGFIIAILEIIFWPKKTVGRKRSSWR